MIKNKLIKKKKSQTANLFINIRENVGDLKCCF